MVFQDPMNSLNPTMTIGRQIAEVVTTHRNVSKSEALERAAEVLDLVGLPRPKERLKDYPHQLSGGLRQRVMIAMSLACDPKLLIADEPTTALDVTIQEQILSLLDRIKRELGMGIILITHDMGVIAGRADRVLVMYAGRKVETAETLELFKNVRHPYTEALLASIPQLDQDRSQELYSIPGLPPDLRRPPLACRFAARCAFATEQCRTHDPPLGGDDPSHPFACFHPRSSSVIDMSDLGSELIAKAEQNKALMASFGKELELLGTAEEPADGSGCRHERQGGVHPGVPGCDQGVPGHLRRDPAPEDRRAARGHRGAAGDPARRDVRSGGRVGLRQDHARSDGRRTRDADQRSGAVRRHGPRHGQGRAVPLDAPRPAVHVPGPLRLTRSAHAGQGDHLRAAGHRPGRHGEGAHREGAKPPRRGWAVLRRDGPLPARVLRRPATAAWPGPSADAQSEGDHRRRAGLGPRRLDQVPDPQPDEAAPGHSRRDLRRDLPRSLGGQVPRRPDRRHVPRQARRDRSGERHLRPAGPPLHLRPARRHSGAESGAGKGKGAQRGRPWRASIAALPPVGLSLPHPLPAGAGQVRRGGPAAAPVRQGPSGRMPLPAPDTAERQRRGSAGPGDSRGVIGSVHGAANRAAPRIAARSARSGSPPDPPPGSPRQA